MRELQAQAIDKRLHENERRGIKDVDNVKAKVAQKKEYEKRQAEADRNRGTNNENQLRVKSFFFFLMENLLNFLFLVAIKLNSFKYFQ
jgi:hypothetical protein